MRFYLQKSGEEMLQPCLGTGEATAQCFISNVDQAHTGEYSCRYSESKPFIISKTSELVRLLMTDQNIARPNISLIPGYIAQLGSKVTIQCSAQGQSKRFYLHKAEDQKNLQIALTNEDRKNFSINKMDWEDGGSFYCSYTEPSQFFTSSETSDRVELFVLDPKLSKPNITLAHTQWVVRGGNATINCHSQPWAAKFLFEKTGKQMPLQVIEINGTMGTFFMKDANLEDGGNYSCRYSAKEKPFSISEPSDLVTIKITDPDLPRPNISFHPSTMPQLGGNITIQCSVNNSYKAWYLYKDDGKKELQSVETSSSNAVFLINNVSEADGGSYYCNYRPQSESFISEASNTVDLYLVDPNFYIPTISMIPSNLVAFGEQVTIKCETGKEAMMFYLHKDGDPSLNWTMESELYHGTVSIHNVSWDNKGSYSCSYVAEKRPKVFSLQSDPIELLVSDSDHTLVNIIRFVIGGLVAVLLGYILTLDRRFQRERVH
nr:immunoglobulin superfamily member 1-like [Zootoca vivipara]